MSDFIKRIITITVIIILGVVGILLLIEAVVNKPIILVIAIVIIGAIVEHSTSQKRKADLTQQVQQNNACCTYEEILVIMYMLLNECSYLGLHIPTEDSIRCTKTAVKWINRIPIYRYQVTVKETFHTDSDTLKQLLNQRIAQTLEYQPLYILDIKKIDNTLLIVVVFDNCPATTALIADYERRKKSAANVSADVRDEDF